jgi:hypothetical protein
MAISRLLISCAGALATLSLGGSPRAVRPALQSPQKVLQDSVAWDTTAWSRLQGAHRVVTTPLSADPMVVAFLTDVFGTVGPLRAVTRNSVAWDSLWMQVTSHGQYASACCRAAATVDFSREMIVAAGNGMRHAGDDIVVVGAATRHDTLYVYILSRSNMLPKCLEDAMVNPIAVVCTIRWAGPVVFAEGAEYGSCARSMR